MNSVFGLPEGAFDAAVWFLGGYAVVAIVITVVVVYYRK